MEQTEYLFDFVERFDLAQESPYSTISVKGGRQVDIDKTNAGYGEWKKWLRELAERKQPVYLLINNANNTVEDVFYPKMRAITSVEFSPKNERLIVDMLPAPCLFYVSFNSPRFAELRHVLETAHSTKTQAYVTTGDDPLEIIDARFK